jgi:predicted transcriptional regulator
MPPHQLTIRYDDDLAREIDELARREGISRNRAVVRLLKEAAGVDDRDRPQRRIGDSLDWFIGSWTEQQAGEFEEAVRDFEVVDEEMWR